ncbi:MAG: hypothetical protein K1X79_06620 [Oligoflexia bacterium]|nr:hypothetical protein [Oligoflexia bacterium]
MGPTSFVQRQACVAFLSAAIAVAVGAHFFPSVQVMASSALLALSLAGITQEQLEANRASIWEKCKSPYQANLNLASYFVRVFAAIFLASFIYKIFCFQPALGLNVASARFNNSFSLLLAHNGGVLLASFVLALVYGAGGLTLVLAWNALNWSQNLAPLVFGGQIELVSRALMVGALLPHLIFEVLGYVLGGMAGTFLGKACTKYHLLSSEFYRVSRACVVIVCLAILALLLAAVFEVLLAGQTKLL